MKRFIFVLTLLFLLTGCTQTPTFPGPEMTLSQYIGYWNARDYAAMYQLLSPHSSTSTEKDYFIARHSQISDGIGLHSVLIENIELEEKNQEVNVSYTLLFKTSTVSEFTQQYNMTMIKGEEQWEINWGDHHIFSDLSQEQTVRVTRQFPRRGDITDRNLEPLAHTGALVEVGVSPGKIENKEAVVSALSVLLQLSEERINRQLNQSWVKPDHFVPLKRVTQRDWEQKKEHLQALSGVMFKRTEGRVYPIQRTLAQTIGYVSEINAEQLASQRERGYRTGDYVGSAGLEAVFEETLAGTIGFTIAIYSPQGELEYVVAQKEAVDGTDLNLSLDLGLAAVAEAALGRSNGSVIILDHGTGEVLSLISKPGFDSNLFAQGITTEQFRELEALDSPFLNRAISGLYPPGSAFKPLTALMALSEGVITPEEAWDTPKQWQPSGAWGGYFINRVDRPAGPVNLTQSIKWSDNVYFADLSLKVGWDSFIHSAQDLGFEKNIPFELGVKTSKIYNGDRRSPLLADSGYGQGELQVTPLHMTLMFAALARGDGSIPVPRLITGGNPTVWIDAVFPPENLSIVDQALLAAVQDSDALAYLDDWKSNMRGKTGTSQISAKRHAAWFVCYFDRYVMAVMLEGDKTLTSRDAIRVAKTILDYGFQP
jgi:penicillin-binding protein 3